MSDTISAGSITDELLDRARAGKAQRAAKTLFGSGQHIMRQTAIALIADATLAEHETPGEATLYVIRGRVDLATDTEKWTVATGELLIIPPERHSLHALEDSVVLLSAVPREHVPSGRPDAEQATSGADRELDVRSLEPAQRHHQIFETYHALTPGTAFVLVNDHDPKPLYYQFAAEHADEFTWDPLEQGPEVWRVRIGRV